MVLMPIIHVGQGVSLDVHALKGELMTAITRLAEATITLRSMEARMTAMLSQSPINFGTHPAEQRVVAASCLTHQALDLLRQAYREAYALQREQDIHQAAILEPVWAAEIGLPAPSAEQPYRQPG
jgi:protein-disulfide isomerase-like protein with CxxC motif